MFGAYPYSQLSVVKSNFLQGGMEFPQIVLISDTITNQNDEEYVIVHEIAHQWWYGVVGNDEYNHAWLDEGLAEYSTMLFYRKNDDLGENFEDLINGATESYKLFEKVYSSIMGSVNGAMDRPLNEFSTEPEYVQLTYTKGVLMFDAVRQSLGERKFFNALKQYYNNFSFKNATPQDLISIFAEYGGNEMESFVYSFLNGKVVIK
jgi:aminopeptidase N